MKKAHYIMSKQNRIRYKQYMHQKYQNLNSQQTLIMNNRSLFEKEKNVQCNFIFLSKIIQSKRIMANNQSFHNTYDPQNQGNSDKSITVRKQQRKNNRQKKNNDQYDQQQKQEENKFYKIVYDGNDKISGYWVNGLLDGEVEIHYHSGDYFKGNFIKGYKINGKTVYKDQGEYEGGFYNELFHGKGVLKLKGKKISAYWLNGVAEQNSIIEYDNGNLYYGSIKQFKKHGYGYLYFLNDTKFHGQFVDDQIKGYGQYYEKGKIKYKGIWLNGALVQPMKLDEEAYREQDDEKVNWDLFEGIFDTKNKINLIDCFVQLGAIQRKKNQTRRLQNQEKQARQLFEKNQQNMSAVTVKSTDHSYSKKSIKIGLSGQIEEK